MQSKKYTKIRSISHVTMIIKPIAIINVFELIISIYLSDY